MIKHPLMEYYGIDAIACLQADTLPARGQDCDFCEYREAVRQYEK